MPPHVQAGLMKNNVGDEPMGLMSAFPTLTAPSLESDGSTVQSKPSLETPIRQTSPTVKFGIHWKQPTLMITFTLCGFTGAVGHHLYYHLLDKTMVSSPENQQWTLRFGSGFSVFTITMLQAAVVAAFNQQIWKLFRDKSFSVADLNKIFALTSDFTGFSSLELLESGRLVIFLASLCWLLPLAGLTPAATLSVVNSLHIEITEQFLPTLNFTSRYWQGMGGREIDDLTKLASIISEQMVIPQLTSPAPNSSCIVQFYGPTIACEDSKGSNQTAFGEYSAAIWNESKTVTSVTLQMFNDGVLYLPNSSEIALESSEDFQASNYLFLSIFPLSSLAFPDGPSQVLIMTANSSIVCSQVNASFELDIDDQNGIQSIIQRNVEIMNILNYSIAVDGISPMILLNTFDKIFISQVASIVGNITSSNFDGLPNEDSENLLNAGLITCEEVFWWTNQGNYNDTIFQGWPMTPSELTEAFLPVEYSRCRNRTISLAIQHLANNITIGLLSNPNMTVNVSTPVTITSSQNIYHYDSRNLIISYATGVAATVLAVIVGLMAIHSNGVCHSTSFSSIMTTTSGNPQIGELSKSQSLGAEPLSKTVAEKKLRLGVIKVPEDTAENDEWGDPINRVGFGLEGTVTRLMKGAKGL